MDFIKVGAACPKTRVADIVYNIENICHCIEDAKNKNIKSQAERMAINTVIQGTAAEILKKVMIKIYEILKDKEDIKLLLQVHDELIFEVAEKSVEKYSKILSEIMTKTVILEDIDLEININYGKNWAEAK